MSKSSKNLGQAYVDFQHGLISFPLNVRGTAYRKCLQVLKDVEINGMFPVPGYTIPAGWTVMVCPPAVHMDPKQYDDPFVFNPWRRYHQNSICDVSKWFPHSNNGDEYYPRRCRSNLIKGTI